MQEDPSAGLQAVGDESSGQPAIGRCGVAFIGDPQPETGLGNGPVERGGGPRAQVHHGRDPGLLGELSPGPGDVVAAGGVDPVVHPRHVALISCAPRASIPGRQGEPGIQVLGMTLNSYSSNSVEK